jgi:hypothetical protein
MGDNDHTHSGGLPVAKTMVQMIDEIKSELRADLKRFGNDGVGWDKAVLENPSAAIEALYEDIIETYSDGRYFEVMADHIKPYILLLVSDD